MVVMGDILTRFAEDLIGRIHGPLTFRFILQPTMAILFAIRDGYKDARTGKPPYFYSLFTESGRRRELLRDGWESVGKIFILAMILEVVYQYIVLPRFYLVQALLISTFLALIPYLLLRGPVNRIFRRTL
jgi:hypothetical protein